MCSCAAPSSATPNPQAQLSTGALHKHRVSKRCGDRVTPWVVKPPWCGLQEASQMYGSGYPAVPSSAFFGPRKCMTLMTCLPYVLVCLSQDSSMILIFFQVYLMIFLGISHGFFMICGTICSMFLPMFEAWPAWAGRGGDLRVIARGQRLRDDGYCST